MPDLGILCKRLPAPVIDEALRHGAQPKIVDYLAEVYCSREVSGDLLTRVQALGGNETDQWLAQRIQIGVWIYHDPKHLLAYMPYIFHIHGKFYEMDANLVEHEVAYDEVMPLLLASRYRGYIMYGTAFALLIECEMHTSA